MRAAIQAIEYYLPGKTVSTAELAAEFPEWSVEKIDQKTGIQVRHIADENECASDLAVAAARKLFDSGACRPQDIDYILFCTQSPDYFLPTTACLIQDRLGIPQTAGALDFNLGCSGYVAGLGLASGLVETDQAQRVLLLTGETYSKHMHPRDKSVRTIFGDAASATIVGAAGEDGERLIGPFVYGTDGSGSANLIVPAGGMRRPRSAETGVAAEDAGGSRRSPDNLYMNGVEIFNFTLRTVPENVAKLLARAGVGIGDVDLFVFHQANQYMLQHLRRVMRIPEERFYVSMRHCGNTVSSTIPVALRDAIGEGRLQPGALVAVVGFGVGYSWASALIRWTL